MEDADFTDGNLLTNEMKIYLDMLHAVILNRVGGEVDNTNVVIVDEIDLAQGTMEFLEQLLRPSGHGHTVGGTIFFLNTRAEDGDLTLGRPGDQVVPKKHHVA
jgi:hypothetical protein